MVTLSMVYGVNKNGTGVAPFRPEYLNLKGEKDSVSRKAERLPVVSSLRFVTIL